MSKRNIVPSVFPNDSTPVRAYYFCVPDLDEWRELFIGHMLGMTYGYFWDKNSGDYDEARSVMSAIVFNGISNSSVDCLCDVVADCILNSDAVQSALDQQSSSDTTGNNSQNLTAGIDTNNCNDDNLFGATLELVNELNNYAVDAFEIIEASTNFVELISEFLGAIPVAGDVLALIPNLLNFFQEIGEETYNASYTSELRDEIACDLFCIYRENCSLSLGQVFDYLWSEFSQSAQPQTITEAINAFVAIGVVVGRVTVFGVFMVAMAFLKLGDGNLPSIPFVALPSTNRLRIALAVGATQPNNSWAVLCDPCSQEWAEQFFSGNGDITVPYTLTYVTGGGVVCTPNYSISNDRIDGCTPAPTTAVGIVLDMNTPFIANEIEFEIEYKKTRSNPNPDTVELIVNGVTEATQSIPNTGNGTRVITASFAGQSVTTIRLDGSVRNNSAGDGSYFRITRARFVGTGVNPF